MSHLISQDLYMEAFSRSENIKFFSIPEEQDEDTGEKLITNFQEEDLGHRNAHSVKSECLRRLSKRHNDFGLWPIIARFLQYKDGEDIFGKAVSKDRLSNVSGSPSRNHEHKRYQMPTFKKARRNGTKASFRKSQPVKLCVNRQILTLEKIVRTEDQTVE